MLSRPLAFAALAALFAAAAAPTPAADADAKTVAAIKDGLSKAGEYIGMWKVDIDGVVDGKKVGGKDTIEWGWKFKDGLPWMAMKAKEGKLFPSGDLKYQPKEKLYTYTAGEEVYTGKFSKGSLVLEGKVAGGSDVRRFTITTLADGARMTVKGDTQSGGKGPFSKGFTLTCSKEGESFAGGGKKKNECIVTGGLGTIPVSYGGKGYFVCCSGCKEEFDANPKKFVDEFEKKK